MDYSPTEIVDILKVIGESLNNYTNAVELYRQRFPDRRCPSRSTMRGLEQRLRQGHLQRHRPRANLVDDDPRTIAILGAVHLNPHISLREIQAEIGIPKSTAQRLLRAAKFHPYHIMRVQELHGNDFANRVGFCNWAVQQIDRDRLFFHRVLFSDECTFQNTGFVNIHNAHYWSAENPHWVRQVNAQQRWSVNVWCGLLGSQIIGPFFFDRTLNGARYLEFLQNDLPVLLEEVDLRTRRTMWFQQDGAPPHYARAVRQHLDELFPAQWIGRGGPIVWPPRSPDLTSPDFFLWGYLKDVVFRDPPTTRENMMVRITNACREISPNTLRACVENFAKRIRLCRDHQGHNFEQFL